MVEDCENSVKKMEELRLYLVELDENSAIQDNMYPLDCVVGGKDCQPVIVIIYDKYAFSADDVICKA